MNAKRKSLLPAIFVANHQDAVPLDLPLLERLLPAAVTAVLRQPPGPGDTLLPQIEEVELSILSDEEISRQHEAFLGDPTPTDVITFHHGELLLSAETAARESRNRSHPVERELLLYAVHGLLHLHGYDDHCASDSARMGTLQDQILPELWPE